ncbi:hypothetical protein ACFSCX_12040 [Bacillus salitolerans]|uniref:Uncharacterized protein n=1 Tax=Bacillus salitolerans TaxID=1437434 RepID=A0ABW4LQ21_9BACI
MSKSKARKYREKIVREGTRNPELSRSPYVLYDLRTKKTKTKKDLLYRSKHKNHVSDNRNDGSFYMLQFVSFQSYF